MVGNQRERGVSAVKMNPRLAFAVALIVSSCSEPRRSPVAADPAPAAASAQAKPSPFALTAPLRDPQKRAAPDPAWEPLLDELRKADGIGGRRVGFGQTESTFHRIARELLPKANGKLVRWLAEDDHPNLRAMGFWGLASLADKETLARHACDRERVMVCPGGCICEGLSLGEIAQNFLWSPTWLGEVGADAGSIPLMSAPERAAFAFQLSGADACRPMGGAHQELNTVRGYKWNWTNVRAATPGVPTWIVVKAVARFEHEGSVPLLTAILEDPTMPVRARLVAASGLTQSTGADAEAALTKQTAFLDGVRAGLGNELRDVLRIRRKLDALVAPIDTAKTEVEKLASNAIDAYALRHPMMLDRVRTSFYGARQHDVDAARAKALVWVSEHLTAYEECWSVYRDTAYKLEMQLAADETIRKKLPGEDLAAFEANVRAATARLDRNVSCLE